MARQGWREFIRSIYTPSGQAWGVNLYIAMFVGLFVAAFYGWTVSPMSVLVALLLSGASMLAGVLLGFLFGIPRLFQKDQEAASMPPAAGGAAAKEQQLRYQGNTNLEQISDWLTKILVGVGLTQLGQLPALYGDLGAYFGPALGGAFGGRVAVCIAVFFPIIGFMIGYLWTRLYLGIELHRSEIVNPDLKDDRQD